MNSAVFCLISVLSLSLSLCQYGSLSFMWKHILLCFLRVFLTGFLTFLLFNQENLCQFIWVVPFELKSWHDVISFKMSGCTPSIQPPPGTHKGRTESRTASPPALYCRFLLLPSTGGRSKMLKQHSNGQIPKAMPRLRFPVIYLESERLREVQLFKFRLSGSNG